LKYGIHAGREEGEKKVVNRARMRTKDANQVVNGGEKGHPYGTDYLPMEAWYATVRNKGPDARVVKPGRKPALRKNFRGKKKDRGECQYGWKGKTGIVWPKRPHREWGLFT